MPGMMARLTHPMTHRRVPALVLALTLAASGGLVAQTPVELRSNRYSPQQDVQLGREAAADIRKQLPALNDSRTSSFIQRIGRRLTSNIPQQYRQPGFRYSFEVLNLSDINAFALPGGPMFLNRGMIQAARTEGEVTGVMAHELAHVVLRHGTAQATAAQPYALGALGGQLLGAIIGGRVGEVVAGGSEIVAGVSFLRYSREFEREADLVGAQIMARAGYDPRHMASMFETIERAGGARGPEWLSSHPNPGNRAQAITREAELLRVAPTGGQPGDLSAVHARLQRLPPAQTTAQVVKARQTGSR
jgi:beta-barrel assembly-enhancing protease